MRISRYCGACLASLMLAGCGVQVREPAPDAAPEFAPIPQYAEPVLPEPAEPPIPVPEPLDAMQEVPVQLVVKPSITRKIGGISDLDRKVYFSLADHGAGLDSRVPDPSIYHLLTHQLRVRFGRDLGPVNGVTRWGGAMREDPERKGFVDLAHLRAGLEKGREAPSAAMLEDYGPNLDVAAHGHPRAYPAFMGEYITDEVLDYHKDQALPENHAASAEYAAAVFKWNYSDFDRPRFFEPINEPHWSFDIDFLADWHMAMLGTFRKARLPMLVGGPCMPVAYMFKKDYHTWKGFARFMDATRGKMDFYSFHAYDFFEWKEEEFYGRIQTGLPMESTLDLIPNYGLIQFNREVPMVISEHGGYLLERDGMSPEKLENELAERFFPGPGFDRIMKKRSILNHQHVRSIINNTLTFMDHPHTLKKAVPFILINTFSWDPEYYASLYVARDFTNNNEWVESANMDFYRLFNDLDGRRVYIHTGDPDLQVQAFADKNILRVIINNLHSEGAPLELDMPPADTYTLRRYGRLTNYTPYLTEDELSGTGELFIRPFETLVLKAEYDRVIPEYRTVNETAHYGKRIVVNVEPGSTEEIIVPLRQQGTIQYAELRLGLRRPAGADRRVEVAFNGQPLDTVVVDHADRLEDASDYASIRRVRINPAWIRAENRVSVSFPDGKEGTVGSVVLRTAM